MTLQPGTVEVEGSNVIPPISLNPIMIG